MAPAPDDLTRAYPWLTDALWHIVVRQSAAVGGGRIGAILQAIDHLMTSSVPTGETMRDELADVAEAIPGIPLQRKEP
jgi:hypothetical protein